MTANSIGAGRGSGAGTSPATHSMVGMGGITDKHVALRPKPRVCWMNVPALLKCTHSPKGPNLLHNVTHGIIITSKKGNI